MRLVNNMSEKTKDIILAVVIGLALATLLFYGLSK